MELTGLLAAPQVASFTSPDQPSYLLASLPSLSDHFILLLRSPQTLFFGAKPCSFISLSLHSTKPVSEPAFYLSGYFMKYIGESHFNHLPFHHDLLRPTNAAPPPEDDSGHGADKQQLSRASGRTLPCRAVPCYCCSYGWQSCFWNFCFCNVLCWYYCLNYE